MPFQQNRSAKTIERLGATENRSVARSVALGRDNAKGLLLGLAVGVALALSTIPVAAAGNGGSAFLVAQKPVKAPSGFNGLCARYDWVCSTSGTGSTLTSKQLELAKSVNRAVNKEVREIEDLRQYGKEEYWALPSYRGGDCEDLVLLKKKILVERGVPSKLLLIATVLDRKLNSHAVLVLRTKSGDLVLDNLTNKVKPWKETGYTFLKLQNPKSLSRWDAVLAGGVISDRPTASR